MAVLLTIYLHIVLPLPLPKSILPATPIPSMLSVETLDGGPEVNKDDSMVGTSVGGGDKLGSSVRDSSEGSSPSSFSVGMSEGSSLSSSSVGMSESSEDVLGSSVRDSSTVGSSLGNRVDTLLGSSLGSSVSGIFGASLGATDGLELGAALGPALGDEESLEVGASEGVALGDTVGNVGDIEIDGLNERLGINEGIALGVRRVGKGVGGGVGNFVGAPGTTGRLTRYWVPSVESSTTASGAVGVGGNVGGEPFEFIGWLACGILTGNGVGAVAVGNIVGGEGINKSTIWWNPIRSLLESMLSLSTSVALAVSPTRISSTLTTR